MSFIQGKAIHGLEEYSTSEAGEMLPKYYGAKVNFIEYSKRQHGNGIVS